MPDDLGDLVEEEVVKRLTVNVCLIKQKSIKINCNNCNNCNNCGAPIEKEVCKYCGIKV